MKVPITKTLLDSNFKNHEYSNKNNYCNAKVDDFFECTPTQLLKKNSHFNVNLDDKKCSKSYFFDNDLNTEFYF